MIFLIHFLTLRRSFLGKLIAEFWQACQKKHFVCSQVFFEEFFLKVSIFKYLFISFEMCRVELFDEKNISWKKLYLATFALRAISRHFGHFLGGNVEAAFYLSGGSFWGRLFMKKVFFSSFLKIGEWLWRFRKKNLAGLPKPVSTYPEKHCEGKQFLLSKSFFFTMSVFGEKNCPFYGINCDLVVTTAFCTSNGTSWGRFFLEKNS